MPNDPGIITAVWCRVLRSPPPSRTFMGIGPSVPPFFCCPRGKLEDVVGISSQRYGLASMPCHPVTLCMCPLSPGPADCPAAREKGRAERLLTSEAASWPCHSAPRGLGACGRCCPYRWVGEGSPHLGFLWGQNKGRETTCVEEKFL